MNFKNYYPLLKFLLLLLLLTGNRHTIAQTTLPNSPKKDTSSNKSNDNKWKDDEANISFEQLNSAKISRPDTNLHTFHRRPFEQPWYRNLGNPGSPTNNLLFTHEYKVGPTLGYHVNDVYRFQLDSLKFYNTTRPYSVFTYQLGSKLEQVAGLLHTQNIRPNWNFMAEYRKVNAPGFYNIQRNNNDDFAFSTNYKSLSKRYTVYAGMVYSYQQHDENGGIVNDSALSDATYIDRRTVDVAYQNSQYSTSRSGVTNLMRNFGLLVQHTYTWGPVDTTYNADSTEYTAHLKPRFSITHKMELGTEKHSFKDIAPDSLRYADLFHVTFPKKSTSYYVAGGDSVFTQQKWFWVDNKFQLNGFIGPDDAQLKFSAGLGNRYDQFISDPTPYYHLDRSRIVSNYLYGEIKKEAIKGGEWEYAGKTTLYFTGDYAGDFVLDGVIGKGFKQGGGFFAGVNQQLGSAPYNYTRYENRYVDTGRAYNKENITTLYATLQSSRLKLSGGVRNYVIGNYIYLNQKEAFSQNAATFNVAQVWLRKVIKIGGIVFDNEFVLQQATNDAPVNVPLFMGRHQLTYEHNGLFEHKLKLATGIEVRETSPYAPAGYSAIYNRFFYQNHKVIYNVPEVAVVLNFALKHFRAFIMADQLQQLLYPNTILYTGSPITNFNGNRATRIPVYAAQNMTIRFGFSWILIN